MSPARLLFGLARCKPDPCRSRQFIRLANRAGRQHGAGAAEFAIVAVPVLLTGLGVIESAQWLFARQAASLALLEAGRAGITQHASPQAMIDAFEHALLPLHASVSHQAARLKLEKFLSQRQQRLGSAPWQIEILSPDAAAYRDFANSSLLISRQSGHAAIDNAYLQEQNVRHHAQGWPEGRGPHSGLDVFQANTLRLRLSYLHEPSIPGMKALLSVLGNERGSYRQRALAAGYLPIVRNVSLMMQSHPVNWPMPAGGKVVGPEAETIRGQALTPSCTGMWCIEPAAATGANTGKSPPPPLPPTGAWPKDIGLPKPGHPTSPSPYEPPIDDPSLPGNPLPSCV